MGGSWKTAMIMSSSLSHVRPLTCASSSLSRIAPHPHDLVKWVTREGGFVHRAVKIAQFDSSNGLGLVAKEQIPIGTDLIVLPQHIPLHFTSHHNHSDSLLLQLSSNVPGIFIHFSIYNSIATYLLHLLFWAYLVLLMCINCFQLLFIAYMKIVWLKRNSLYRNDRHLCYKHLIKLFIQIGVFELVYWYEHLWNCLGELMVHKFKCLSW
jgi:hypothetical protein